MTYLRNYQKVGIFLLVIFLIAGMLVMVSFAQNKGNAGGKKGFARGNMDVGPGNRKGGYNQDAPDIDQDGIPNGLDPDYAPDCSCECCSADDDGDGIPNCQDPDYQGTYTCESEPQGNQWGKQ